MIQLLLVIIIFIAFAFWINYVLRSKRLKDKRAELDQVREDEVILSIEEEIAELEAALKKRRDLLKQKEGEAKDVK